jgi:hypothetical protein
VVIDVNTSNSWWCKLLISWGGEKVAHLETKKKLSELKGQLISEHEVGLKQAVELKEYKSKLEHYDTLCESAPEVLQARCADAEREAHESRMVVELLEQQLSSLRPALDTAEAELAGCEGELLEAKASLEAKRTELLQVREQAASAVAAAQEETAAAVAKGEEQRLELKV